MAGMASEFAKRLAMTGTPESRKARASAAAKARWSKFRKQQAAETCPTPADTAQALLDFLPDTRQFSWWRERLPELVAMLR